MVNARLRIDFANNEGALLRILGVVERRGFMIKSVAMNEHADGSSATLIVEIAPRSDARRLDVLVPFLQRLVEVRSINAFEPMQDQAA